MNETCISSRPRIAGFAASLHRPLQLCVSLYSFVAIPAFPGTNPALVEQAAPQRVFGGGQRPISVMWNNHSDSEVNAAISTRLYQASSSTAVLLREASWKTLQILAGQTVAETAILDLPAVRAETHFLVQWLQASNIVSGTTEILVYPTNQLEELGRLADGGRVGVFDPQNRLKPLLRALPVDFADLEANDSKAFSGRLAIFGPFDAKSEVRQELPSVIETLANRGVSVVWILPAAESMLKPSFYPVPMGKGVVLVAQSELVAQLEQRPQSQLNLIELCRQALHPKPFTLPLLAAQP